MSSSTASTSSTSWPAGGVVSAAFVATAAAGAPSASENLRSLIRTLLMNRCRAASAGHGRGCGGSEPSGPLGIRAPRDAEVQLAQPLGDRAGLAVADDVAVDLADGHDLVCRAAEEQLLREVELARIDRPLGDGQSACLGELDDRRTGDALKDPVCGARGAQLAVADQEDVHGRAFSDAAVLVQDHGG